MQKNLMNILRPLSPHLPIYKSQLTSTFRFPFSFLFFGMPLREQGVPRTSGGKTKQGEFLVGGNPLIAY